MSNYMMHTSLTQVAYYFLVANVNSEISLATLHSRLICYLRNGASLYPKGFTQH